MLCKKIPTMCLYGIFALCCICCSKLEGDKAPQQFPSPNAQLRMLQIDTILLRKDAHQILTPQQIFMVLQFIDSVSPSVRIFLPGDTLGRENIQGTHSLYSATMEITRIHRIIRCSLRLRGTDTTSTSSGYAIIRYQTQDGKWLSLPALYDAVVRAITASFGSSLSLPEKYQRAPLPLLITAGTVFHPTPAMKFWEISQNKILFSYKLTLHLTNALAHLPYWIVADLDSRDSLYEKHGLWGVEHYNAPTPEEYRILEDFGFEFVALLEITPLTEKHGEMKLSIFRLQNHTAHPFIAITQPIVNTRDEEIIAALDTLLHSLQYRYLQKEKAHAQQR